MFLLVFYYFIPPTPMTVFPPETWSSGSEQLNEVVHRLDSSSSKRHKGYFGEPLSLVQRRCGSLVGHATQLSTAWARKTLRTSPSLLRLRVSQMSPSIGTTFRGVWTERTLPFFGAVTSFRKHPLAQGAVKTQAYLPRDQHGSWQEGSTSLNTGKLRLWARAHNTSKLPSCKPLLVKTTCFLSEVDKVQTVGLPPWWYSHV